MACFKSYKREIFSTLGLILINASVQCIADHKISPTSSESGRWKILDTYSAGSDLRQPELYNTLSGYRKHFVTSNNEEKYTSDIPSYEIKNEFGPFRSGSIYNPGGLYEQRNPHDTPYSLGYNMREYETPYNFSPQRNRYGFNYMQDSKDITRSVLIPLAGVTLLGIAAALVANPVLLHLGITAGKRKRRDITSAHALAYKAQMYGTST